MLLKRQRPRLLLSVAAVLMLIAATAAAQDDTTPKKRLKSPQTVKGFIGGESHDSYVIRAARGHVLTIELSWRREGDNNAGFTISESPDFFGAEPVGFGEVSGNATGWHGKIPKTRDYYIYIVGHPVAHYTLKVRIK